MREKGRENAEGEIKEREREYRGRENREGERKEQEREWTNTNGEMNKRTTEKVGERRGETERGESRE